MNNFGEIFGAWFYEFWHFFWAIAPRWFSAWLVALLVLLFSFRGLKPKLRTRAMAFDGVMNTWARSLRYKLLQADAKLEPNTPPSERVLLTWFFRFWTNFASAPSLSILAFVIPIWFFYRPLQQFVSANAFEVAQIAGSTSELFAELGKDTFDATKIWLLPAFCYFGSMGLSYVLKRIFKRIRPPRDKGAFGHGLRDASFPSGHSLTAFCFWTGMIVSVTRATSTPFAAIAFALIAIAIVLLTGLSRFYMAVHWPSDVAGGYIIGAVWTVIFLVACGGWF